jgi:hypothetical protein
MTLASVDLSLTVALPHVQYTQLCEALSQEQSKRGM